jgi:hypothetical protein
MAEISTKLGQLPAGPSPLSIPKEIAGSLPDQVLAELARLPEAKQTEFVAAFHNQSRSLGFAYLTSLIYCHYGLLGRWAMTGFMWLSLFVTSTLGPILGSIWWLIDLVRMPGMVRTHNHQVAADILRQLNGGSDTAPLPGS